VHIWSLSLKAVGESDWPLFEALLDDAERDRAATFSFVVDRQAFVAGRALTRCMLARFCGCDARAWRFEAGSDGKPRVVNSPPGLTLGFSLSHTACMVAAAVACSQDIGIDVEAADYAPSDVFAIAETFFTPDEVTALCALSDERPISERFLSLWTLKEAVVKATGRGMAQETNAFSILSFRPVRVRFRTMELGDPAHWAFWQQAVGSHVLAVAVRGASAKSLRFLHRAIVPRSIAQPRRRCELGAS
jgi:4'-phosphopantetheinyl transferase